MQYTDLNLCTDQSFLLIHYGGLMIEVYRIEHSETGLGPFQINDEWCQKHIAGYLTDKLNQFKPPQDDGLTLSKIPFSWKFGSPTIRGLYKWLGCSEEDDSRLSILRQKGFRIGYFVCEENLCMYGRSRIQIIFDRDTCVQDNLVEWIG